jgi:hypothetical protein
MQSLQFTLRADCDIFVKLLPRTDSANLLLKTELLRHSSPSYKALNCTSVTVAWKGHLPVHIAATSQVRGVLRHSREREGHMIFPYSGAV